LNNAVSRYEGDAHSDDDDDDDDHEQQWQNNAQDHELYDAVSRQEADTCTEQRQTDDHGNKWPG